MNAIVALFILFAVCCLIYKFIIFCIENLLSIGFAVFIMIILIFLAADLGFVPTI